MKILIPIAMLALATGCATSDVDRGDLTGTFAITNVSVIDVEAGEAIGNRTVLIRNDRIVAVTDTSRTKLYRGGTAVDGTGKFLIPGLWDMHAHLPEERWSRSVALPMMIAHGVTGVREMSTDCPGCSEASDGSFYAGLTELRDRIQQGRELGPRLIFTSAPIDGPPGTAMNVKVAANPEAARALVVEAAAAKVDTILVYSGLEREANFAVADEARKRGLTLASTIPHTITLEEAAASGVRSEEGMTAWLLACSRGAEVHFKGLQAAIAHDHASDKGEVGKAAYKRYWNDNYARIDDAFDRKKCEALARRMSHSGMWVVPKLMEMAAMAQAGNYENETPKAWPGINEWWEDQREEMKPESREAATRRARRERELVTILHDAGVPMLAGSETYALDVLPGLGLQQELALLVKAGLKPIDALRMATLEPARFFGQTDTLGTVAKGRFADLVLLNANPLVDIRNTQRIDAVILKGRYLDRMALDKILADAQASMR